MNTNIKIPHDGEDLNPKEQSHREEFINLPLYFLSIAASGGGLHKVSCPEATSIFQGTSNVHFLRSRESFNPTEDGVVIQVADVLLQPFLHQIET